MVQSPNLLHREPKQNNPTFQHRSRSPQRSPPKPHLLPSRSLPRTLTHIIIGTSPFPLGPLLLGIQDEAQDIKGEFREIHAHLPEGAFGLVAQDMGALAPEAGDGFADGVVVAGGMGVDVAGVGEFGGGGGVDEVDFGVGEGFEGLRVVDGTVVLVNFRLSAFLVYTWTHTDWITC